MKFRTLTAIVALVALLTACETVPMSSQPVVLWATSDGQPIANIVKQPGMEIAFITEQDTIGRISVPDDDPGNQGTIELERIPFLIKLPNQEALLYSGPNALPCSVGDECVPPVPPQLVDAF